MRRLANGDVKVSWQQGSYDNAAALADALRDREIRVHVIPAPASPGMVDKVLRLGVAGNPQNPPGVRFTPVGPDTELRIDPSRFTGTIDIHAGVQATPGQRYAVPASAFAPGEVFDGMQCATGWPIDSATLQRLAARTGVRLQWKLWRPEPNPGDPSSTQFAVTPTRTRPSGTALMADAVSPTLVEVSVVTGQDEAAMLPGVGDKPTTRCTPELTARWR